MTLVTDISERVEQERRTWHLEKLAAVGSLAVGIAQELNNPIGIILSRIELMVMEVEEQRGTAALLGDLQALHRQVQRLSRLAEGILSFGRQRQRHRQPIDLTAIVQDTLLLARSHLDREGIHVDTMLDASLPRVSGDPTALEQVLMNLLLDARDAMPSGGTIRIETSGVSGPGRLDAIRLVVSDTRHGKPGPLFTAKSDGTGLDLAVNYTILRDDGGTVDVRSEPGRGTSFTFSFPPADSAPRSG
jgi:signal transduction histidine kinase